MFRAMVSLLILGSLNVNAAQKPHLESYSAIVPDIAVQKTDKRVSYDPIASEHRDSIANRLKLVEILVREYGRAYDYRVLTTQELEAIVADLRNRPKEVAEVKKSAQPE